MPLLGSPGQQLRSALGLPPSPPRSPGQQSPRGLSSTIFRTCAVIAGLVIINAILAGAILSAVHSFSGYACQLFRLHYCKHAFSRADFVLLASQILPFIGRVPHVLRRSSKDGKMHKSMQHDVQWDTS